MTSNVEVCKSIPIADFVSMVNIMFEQTAAGNYSSEFIHELALKSLINMCAYSSSDLESIDLKQLFT